VAEREILISDVAGLPPDNSLIAPFTYEGASVMKPEK
jgi:hypothetical protein